MKRSLLLASFLALLSWSPPKAQAASDYLLELDGIKGESSDSTHPGNIELASFSWGATNVPLLVGGGGGAGKVSFQDLHFTTSVSKASPQLFLACASGTHIKKATLFVRKAGGTQDYYVITLSDILVTGISQGSGTPGGTTTPAAAPTESFSLNFTKIEWEYRAADATTPPVKSGWDLATGKPT